jgi:peptidoglycan hydrolase-like protein with peptidoglycan-binding domain
LLASAWRAEQASPGRRGDRCPIQPAQEHAARGIRYSRVEKRFVFVVAAAIGFAIAGSVFADDDVRPGWAEDNVRAVQQKLRDGGFYSGEVDGACSSELALALTRYQIRNGLPITGQLDVDTSKALGVKPAAATTPADLTKSSETWRRLRAAEQQTQNNARVAESPRPDETPRTSITTTTREGAAATGPMSSERAKPASAPPAPVSSSPPPEFSTERLRDYVGAFVLAGLDPHVGAETDFFADQVQYYDQGVMSRDKIRKDLQRYAAHWPQRRFWLAGDITVEPENGNRVRVTFPLRYELRNGPKHLSGKINKTLVLESAGDDLQIVSVNERKAEG